MCSAVLEVQVQYIVSVKERLKEMHYISFYDGSFNRVMKPSISEKAIYEYR